MKFEFTRHDPVLDKIILVLTLDKQKMKERILIGTELDVRFRLQGHTDTDLFCDVTRPLGTFLSGFEHDESGEWNQFALTPIRQALSTRKKMHPSLEKTACDFLAKKYLTGDPVRMYAAFRIWNGYLQARLPADRDTARDKLMEKMSLLTLAFQTEQPLRFDPDTGKPKPFHISSARFRSVPEEETRLTLWYPDNRITEECVSMHDSFYPLITYYSNRVNDFGLYFRKCKVCGKVFLAKNLRYEFCSEKCRKAQALQKQKRL